MKVFIFLIMLSQNIFAFGEKNKTDGCILASLSREGIKSVNEGCELSIKSHDKKEKDFVLYVKKCPLPFDKKYVFAYLNTFEMTSLDKREFDYFEISNEKRCDQNTLSQVYNYKGFYNNKIPTSTTYKNNKIEIELFRLEKNTPLQVLRKKNFFKIRNEGNIWTYHSVPGVSVDVEITGLKCSKEICLDEKIQTIKKILSVYVDFIYVDKTGSTYYSSATDSVMK